MNLLSTSGQRIAYIFCVIALNIVVSATQAQDLPEQNDEYHKKMEWFKDAKLGIFIHWGLYAVNGIDESWSFF